MRLFYLKDVRWSCYCTRYTSSQNSAGDILHIRVFATHLVVRSNKISTLVNCQLVTLIYPTTLLSIILSSNLWIVILLNCSLTFSFFNMLPTISISIENQAFNCNFKSLVVTIETKRSVIILVKKKPFYKCCDFI